LEYSKFKHSPAFADRQFRLKRKRNSVTVYYDIQLEIAVRFELVCLMFRFNRTLYSPYNGLILRGDNTNLL